MFNATAFLLEQRVEAIKRLARLTARLEREVYRAWNSSDRVLRRVGAQYSRRHDKVVALTEQHLPMPCLLYTSRCV